MSSLKTIRRTCAISLGATAIAFCVVLIAGASGQRAGFALFVAAIIVGAFFEGFIGGLAATGLATLGLLTQHVVLHHDSPFRSAPDLLLSTALLLAIGALVALLTGECRGLIRQLTKLHQTIARHPDGVIQTDALGKVQFLNESAQRLTGWTVADAVGQLLTDVGIWTSEDDARPLHLVDRLTQTETRSFAGSAKLQARAGSETLVEYRAETLSGDGVTEGWLINLHEIGEQRRQNAALRERDERLRIVTQGTTAGLLLLDRDGNCTMANPRATALLGLASECRDRSWLSAVHPDDRAAAQGWLQACREGSAFAGEWRVQRSGEPDRWMCLRAVVAVGDGGLPIGSLGTLLDVTEERAVAEQAAESKRELAELEVYHAERIVALEESQARLQKQVTESRDREEAQRQGYDKEKQAWQQAGDERRREHERHQEQWQQTEEKLRRELDDQAGTERKTRQQLDAAHAEFAWHRDTWQKTEADIKRNFQDAERKLAEQRTASEQASAAAARERDTWAKSERMMSQEIETLSSAKQRLEGDLEAAAAREADLWAELEQQSLEHQQREESLRAQGAAATEAAKASESLLRYVGEQGRRLMAELEHVRQVAPSAAPIRLGKLIRHVHAITRLWRDEDISAMEPVELRETLDRAMALSSFHKVQQRVRLTLPLQPVWVLGDPELLAIALAALLNNAAEHTSPGANIAIEAETADNTLVLRVRDDGPGLTEQQLESLAHVSATARRFDHDPARVVGLGLAVARSVAERCRGKLTVSACLSRGSEFALRLPMLAAGSTPIVPADDGPRLLPFLPDSGATSCKRASLG